MTERGAGDTKVLSFIDAHQHFQDLTHHHYPWLSDRNRPAQLEGDLESIRRDYLPADYAHDVATADVRKTVHVQNGWDPSDPVGETHWLQELAEASGRPDAIVAYADLADPNVERVLAAHAETPALRGIRQILNWHDDHRFRVAPTFDQMEQAAWRRGFALLDRYGLSFDLQIYWPQMDMAFRLAEAFPKTQLILNHFGMPIDRSMEGIQAWANAMTRLARAPNVTVKLSGFGLGHPRWTPADTLPLLHRTIATFGPNRTMVGTNLPVDGLFAKPATILATIREVVAPLSPAERDGVLFGTAERIYRV